MGRACRAGAATGSCTAEASSAATDEVSGNDAAVVDKEEDDFFMADQKTFDLNVTISGVIRSIRNRMPQNVTSIQPNRAALIFFKNHTL